MKLRTEVLLSPTTPDQTRAIVAYVLGALGWQGMWLGEWGGLAHHGSQGASIVVGPLAPFCEIRWEVQVDPDARVVVRLAQTRNTCSGKGGILDGRQAARRLDALLHGIASHWPAPVAPVPAH